jgi:hypothetical protein
VTSGSSAGVELRLDRLGDALGQRRHFADAHQVLVRVAGDLDDVRARVAELLERRAQLADRDVTTELELDLRAAGEVDAEVRAGHEDRGDAEGDDDRREHHRDVAVAHEVDDASRA